jgi:hypothetical protein
MNNVLFRASSLGKLMTDARTKSGLSETCKSELLNVYLREKYKRTNDFSNKYVEKGLAVERDAIDVWRRHAGEIVFQNTQRFSNDFITGLPDLIITNDHNEITNIPDIKSSWSLHTFYDAKIAEISKDYYWQGQAYCWLTGAPKATFCFVLVNAPLELINDEKYRLARRMGVIDRGADAVDNDKFKSKAKQIERNMIYDMAKFIDDNPNAQLETNLDEWTYDIPVSERIHEKIVEFDQSAIDKLVERVPMWREYLETLTVCGYPTGQN